MEPRIKFENDNLFVFEKPAGLVVNRSDTQKSDDTLQDYLLKTFTNLYDPDQFSNPTEDEAVFIERTGIAHRIDKDTSGLIIVAKNPQALKGLMEQFQNREVSKKYVALCFGVPKGIRVGESFEIDAPILRNPKNRHKFAVSVDGKPSLTQFTLIEILTDSDGQNFSLLECYPKTGRTHQIRVHLTALNTPILGDEIYSGKERYKKYSDVISRQCLHASYLCIKDPMTNQEIEVMSTLPNDMLSVIDSIKGI